MNNSKYPFCSIVVLNYFGEKVLEAVLNALLNLDYPKSQYEVIIVDNASTDNSLEIMKRYSQRGQQIKTIFLNKNYGFSKGNNFGIKASSGEYVVLLNNDCLVDRTWLKELVLTAKKDDKIFAVNSKINLYPRYLTVSFDEIFAPLVIECFLLKSNLINFSPEKKIPIKYIKENGSYSLDIVFDGVYDQEIEVAIVYSSYKYKKRGIKLNGIPEGKYQIIKQDKDKLTLKISLKGSWLKKAAYDLVQNAGIVVFQDGYGRDIGAVVKAKQQFYETDYDQYDQEREVYAACAGASLYNGKILKKLGFLDESFFMYYEDVEISERARLNGYKIVYCPKAVVRHLHALSSKEWSPFFIFQVEKGRLLHVYYNFPFKVFIKEYSKFFLKFFNTLMIILVGLRHRETIRKIMKLLAKSPKDEDEEISRLIKQIQYLRVLFYFVVHIFDLSLRKGLKRLQVSNAQIRRNYEKILQGDWYFK